jgi:hypothetical protein
MTFAPSWLFPSLVVSGIGLVLLMYGRRQQRWPHIIAGLAFLVYPLLTPTVGSMATVGAVIGLVLWIAVRQGW